MSARATSCAATGGGVAGGVGAAAGGTGVEGAAGVAEPGRAGPFGALFEAAGGDPGALAPVRGASSLLQAAANTNALASAA
jgi:hypothetical protein